MKSAGKRIGNHNNNTIFLHEIQRDLSNEGAFFRIFLENIKTDIRLLAKSGQNQRDRVPDSQTKRRSAVFLM